MNIQSLNAANKILENTKSATQGMDKSEGTPFKMFFDAAMDNLDEVNTLQKNADQMSVDLALGKIDNVADVMIAQEKASIALQYTVQLRNKLLDAYNEIMRLQV